MPPRFSLLLVASSLALLSCSEVDPPPTVPACEQSCQDNIAFRATREMMKLLYNLTLQNQPEGAQDLPPLPCPFGGTARISGNATADSLQGVTTVDLVYEFNGCGYLQKDDEAPENYDIKLTGVLSQKGKLSAQSGAQSAVIIKSDQVTIVGTLYDPAVSYSIEKCGLTMVQNGNEVSGTLCDRKAGFQF